MIALFVLTHPVKIMLCVLIGSIVGIEVAYRQDKNRRK